MGDPAAPTLRTLSVQNGKQIAEARGTAGWRTNGATEVVRVGDDLFLTLVPSGDGAGQVLTTRVDADGNFTWVKSNNVQADVGGDGRIAVTGGLVLFPRATAPTGQPFALDAGTGEPVTPAPALMASAKDLLLNADTNDGSTVGFTSSWDDASSSVQVRSADSNGSVKPLWSEPDLDLVGACGGAFILHEEQTVVARAPKDGAEVWRGEVDGTNPKFLCDGARLVAASTAGLFAWDAVTGEPVWNGEPTWLQIISADSTTPGKAASRFVVTGEEGDNSARVFTMYQGS